MAAYNPGPGKYRVQQHQFAWRDADRQRDVPVLIYRPDGVRGPWPAVLFSPGAGSSRTGYTYLGRHWASHGYVAVHITHMGGDDTAAAAARGYTRRWMNELMQDVDHRRERPRDLSFALDCLSREAMVTDWIDLERIAVSGHSIGSFTALALVGLTFEAGVHGRLNCRDERVCAAIVMSPQGPGMHGQYEDSWAGINCPVLALTGTHDIEYDFGTAARRRTSFDRTPGPDQYLMTIAGATHGTFDDPPELRVRVKPPDPLHHEIILATSTAFLDAYLRDNIAAHAWLSGSGPERTWGAAGKLECKRVTPVK